MYYNICNILFFKNSSVSVEENWGNNVTKLTLFSMGEHSDADKVCLPSGYVNSLLLKMAIEIVSFPIKNGDFP